MASLSDEDIRYFLADQSVSEHSLAMDLKFSSEAIASAKKRAAASYNSLPPLIHNVNPQSMHSDTNIFLFGVAYHLYLTRRMELADDDISFSAGNVNVDLTQRQIQHIDKMLPLFKEEFEKRATDFKITMNRHAGMGQVG